jgi:hypothetical protein
MFFDLVFIFQRIPPIEKFADVSSDIMRNAEFPTRMFMLKFRNIKDEII